MVVTTCINQSKESKQLLMITTFISVGIVTLILVMTCPLVNRVFARERQVVKFLHYLKQESIESALLSTHQY